MILGLQHNKTYAFHLQVTILEGASRIGGRIETYRDPSGDWFAELGAMRIPGPETHKLVNKFIDKFNLTMRPFHMYNPNTFYYVNNRPPQTAKAVADNIDLLGYDLLQNETRIGSADGLYNYSIKPILEYDAKFGWNKTKEKYDHYSIKEWLDESPLSKGAKDLIGIVLNEESLFQTAVLESIRDTQTINDDTTFRELVDGSEALPNAFLKVLPLGENVHLNSMVTRIERKNGKVTVFYQDKSAQGNPVKSVTGDYVILTTTTKAAQLIEFEPPLSEAKTDAMRKLNYDKSTKIYLYFSEAFWEKQGIFGGKSITDKKNRFVYYTSHKLQKGGVVLASYTWGEDAGDWASICPTPEQEKNCIDEALKILATIHGKKAEDLQKIFVNGKIKRWSLDEFAHGAFALFNPTQEKELFEDLKSQENRIFFAGEHTTLYHAWIEGSIGSGIRSALQINQDTYDVAIVGGGPNGLAAAEFLAHEGKKVIVIEKDSFKNTKGSSAGISRQFRNMYENEYLANLTLDAIPWWKSFENWSNRTMLYQNGYLFLGDPNQGSTTEGDFKKIMKVCTKLKMGCKTVTNEDLVAKYNFTDIPKKWIGLYHEGSGEINVQATFDGLLALLHDKNATKGQVTLREKTVVEKISVHPKNVMLRTNSGYVHAKKVILAPGPYANNVFKLLNFSISLDIWELTSIYYKLKKNASFPTWFAFGGDKSNLFYGFPENSWERPGYVRISPDFVQKAITDPSERTNKPDMDAVEKTTKFVRDHLKDVDWNNTIVEQSTCLATMVPDDGFVLDFAPPSVQYNENVIVIAGGWGFKFVPLFGKIISDLVINGKTKFDIKPLSITRPGILVNNHPFPPGPHHSKTAYIIVGCVLGGLILIILVGLIVRRKYKRRSGYVEFDNPTA